MMTVEWKISVMFGRINPVLISSILTISILCSLNSKLRMHILKISSEQILVSSIATVQISFAKMVGVN